MKFQSGFSGEKSEKYLKMLSAEICTQHTKGLVTNRNLIYYKHRLLIFNIL